MDFGLAEVEDQLLLLLNDVYGALIGHAVKIRMRLVD